MALVSDHRDVRVHEADGFFAALGRWLAEAHRVWAHRRSVYRTQRALAALNDRTLGDLGLNHSSILSASIDAADREFGPVDRDRRYH